MKSNYPFKRFQIIQTFNQMERGLQWELESLFQDLKPFNFIVEASETPDFSSLLYTIDAGDSFYVLDNSKQVQNGVPTLQYRVKLTTGSGKVYYSPNLNYNTSTTNAHLFDIANEIARKEAVRLKYVGMKGWILKRKNYGELDPSSVDPVSGAPLNDRDMTYGTGFTQGYYKPLLTTYSREAYNTALSLNTDGNGAAATEQMQFRILGFPLINPYDVLITDDNMRYYIRNVTQHYMPGSDIIFAQTGASELLPYNDPLYKISVP